MKKAIILICVALLTIVGIVGGFFAVKAIQNAEAKRKAQTAIRELQEKYTRTYCLKEEVSESEREEILGILSKRADEVVEDASVKETQEGDFAIYMPGASDEDFVGVVTTATITFVAGYEEGNREPFLDGENIKKAEYVVVQDSTTGLNNHTVNIQLDEDGTALFADMTEKEIGNNIYILYNDEVIMAPRVLVAITNGNVTISNIATKEEAKRMVIALSCGKLKYELEEVR